MEITEPFVSLEFELDVVDSAIERLGEALEDEINRVLNVKIVHLKT